MEIKNERTKAFFQVALSGISFGTIPIFSALLREQNISVAFQVFFRLSVTAIILIPFMWYFKGYKLGVTKRHLTIFATNGLLIFGAFFTYISSIALGTPAAKAVLLTYIYPVFAVFLGMIFLKEGVSVSRLPCITLAMIGVAMVMELWSVENITKIRTGEILAIGNSFFYACIIVLGRYVGRECKDLHPLSTIFFSFVFALLWLAFVTFILQFTSLQILFFSLTDLHRAALPYLIGIGVLSTAIPYLLLYYGLRKIEAMTASLLLLLEPISVIIMSKAILDEPIKLWQIIGGICILLAVVVSYQRYD
ncbi:MAG: DMT family transporter [Sedimentisphaerales bacterium]